MKKLTTLTAALIGASVMMAGSANAQTITIDSLTQKMRQDASKTAAENAERVARFKQRRDQQASILAQARNELNSLKAKAKSVENTFNANDGRINGLKGELDEAQGEFREVFGLARSKASEFKSVLDSSIITSQRQSWTEGSAGPRPTDVLSKVANSESLPNSDELNQIWELMLEEIQAQRKVETYSAQVANDDEVEAQQVTRVGPFTVFTQSGDFLEYNTPSDENKGTVLSTMTAQPGGGLNAAAARVTSASAGSMIIAPIDPTRGSLLKAQELKPDVKERIAQGGVIGYIIIGLAIIGTIFGLLRILFLFLTSRKVASQKRKAQPSKSNPLGRVMMAYEASKDKDEDTVELKLDEAILRESPKLEFGLNFLKLGAGIAPLLGLLGTVTGMIKTFQAMMIYGAGDPQLMAGGISEALVTTMLGLIAAIPLLILHSFCASLARGVQNTLEEQSAGIVARHVEARR